MRRTQMPTLPRQRLLHSISKEAKTLTKSRCPNLPQHHAQPRAARTRLVIRPPQIFSPPPPNDSTADDSQTADTASTPRKRKRSLTPVTAQDHETEAEQRPSKKTRLAHDTIDNEATATNSSCSRKRSLTPETVNENEDEEERRPTKRARSAENIVEAKAASSSHGPMSRQPSLERAEVQPPRVSPPPSVEPQHGPDEATASNQTTQCVDGGAPSQPHPGTGPVPPDENIDAKANTSK